MMPLSYQNIGFTFIFLMVVILVIAELIRYLTCTLALSDRISPCVAGEFKKRHIKKTGGCQLQPR